MSWLETYTGRKLSIYNHDADDDPISIIDIARGLALQNRFAGQTEFPYSVAQHSVVLCMEMESMGRGSCARNAILHDAAEAFLGDKVKPYKADLGSYPEVEIHLRGRIYDAFGVTEPDSDTLRLYDSRLCLNEKAAVKLAGSREWDLEKRCAPIPGLEVKEMHWRIAEMLYLLKFSQHFPGHQSDEVVARIVELSSTKKSGHKPSEVANVRPL